MSELRPKYLVAVRDGLGLSGVSGDVKAGGGSWLGDEEQQPEAAGCLHLDGSIQKSEGIGCRILRDTDQSIPTGAWTAVSFRLAQKNDFALWSLGAPYDVIIDRPGFYFVSGCVELETFKTGGGYCVGLRITVNGVPISLVADDAAEFVNHCLNVTGGVWLDELSAVRLEVYQDSGLSVGALALADHSPSLAAVRLA